MWRGGTVSRCRGTPLVYRTVRGTGTAMVAAVFDAAGTVPGRRCRSPFDLRRYAARRLSECHTPSRPAASCRGACDRILGKHGVSSEPHGGPLLPRPHLASVACPVAAACLASDRQEPACCT